MTCSSPQDITTWRRKAAGTAVPVLYHWLFTPALYLNKFLRTFTRLPWILSKLTVWHWTPNWFSPPWRGPPLLLPVSPAFPGRRSPRGLDPTQSHCLLASCAYLRLCRWALRFPYWGFLKRVDEFKAIPESSADNIPVMLCFLCCCYLRKVICRKNLLQSTRIFRKIRYFFLRCKVRFFCLC